MRETQSRLHDNVWTSTIDDVFWLFVKFIKLKCKIACLHDNTKYVVI